MIDIKNLSIQFTGENLFEDVNLKINIHEKIALVGSNGTGKSTFLKIIYGLEKPESGIISRQKGIRIGYLPQDLISFKNNTLFNEIKSALPDVNFLDIRETEILEQLNSNDLADSDRNELLEELGDIHYKKEEVDFYSADSKIEKVLAGLGFSEQDFIRNTEEFSGGWQMRIQLAKILLAENDIILLDEPTNHLDIDTLSWLEEYLQNYKGSLIIISHDRHFINRVTNKTLEIFNRQLSFYSGNYSSYLTFKAERDEQLRAQKKNQEKKYKDIEKFIERFKYKASKARQVQSRIKMLEKTETISLIEDEKKIDLKFPEPPRSGVIPIEFNNISKSYGNLKVLENVNLQIERNDKIAIVGPNGAGKTTLAKIIGSKIQPSSGELKMGHNTVVSYYEQEVADSINPEFDLLDALMEINDELSPGQLRTILGSFLFSGDDVFKKIKVLSGGEKSRVALSRLLLTKSNLIILDEPTNHLDFSSKEILKNALVNFSGTLIIVSHDIDFLTPIVNKVIEIRNHKIKTYPGGIEYYLQKRVEESNNQEEIKIQSLRTNRKDQKRVEAEIRQKIYSQTKDLKQSLQKCEEDIEKLEKLKDSLEIELSDPLTFTNPHLAKETNSKYENVINQLNYCYNQWTELTNKIEEIEKTVS
jgi:ATP-binding cassette, subfamily F, member 3